MIFRILTLQIITYVIIIQTTCGTPKAIAQDTNSYNCNLYSTVSAVTFGDSLTVIGSITVPNGYHLISPAIDVSGYTNSVNALWQRSDSFDDDNNIIYYGFLIYAFSPDSLQVGPIKFEITSPAGDYNTATTNTLVVPVKSVLAEADTLPYANMPPVTIVSRGIHGWLLTLFILIAAIIIVLVVLYILKKRSIQPQTIPYDESIDEIAEFKKIAFLSLHEKGMIKDLYVLTSSAMRGFIHRNMPFDARHETTTEILRELHKTNYDSDIIKQIEVILVEADQVKFAKFIPSVDESSSLVDRALQPVISVLSENEKRQAALEEKQDQLKDTIVSTDTDDSEHESAISAGGSA